MDDDDDAGAPAGAGGATLTEVIAELEEEGWRGRLTAVEGGAVHCAGCDAVTSAASLVTSVERRLEGASDPADMVLVVAAECPSCLVPSTLVLGYGPAASVEDADVVANLAAGAAGAADPESPGATIDGPAPAEPNEPA